MTKGDKILKVLTFAQIAGNPNQQPKNIVSSVGYKAENVFPHRKEPTNEQIKEARENAEEEYGSWDLANRADPGIGPTEEAVKKKLEKDYLSRK